MIQALLQSRYYYYLIILNMLANIVVFVPQILINERESGAISSMAIAMPVGLGMAFIFTKAINKFPGKGIPEIFTALSVPKWIAVPVLLFASLIWFIAGIISLLAFSDITKRFINPDVGNIYIATIFLVLVIGTSLLSSAKILYFLEIILIVNLPLILFIFAKAYFNDTISYTQILEAATHYQHWPSWKLLSASTYIFTGYINLIIFNRFFTKKINLKLFWLLIPVSIVTLFTTYFIPIGYYGFEGIEQLNFPWLSTADAIRVNLAFVERVFFIFLLLYIGISLINVIVHWHVGLQLLISVVPQRKRKWRKIRLEWVVLSAFSVLYLLFQIKSDDLITFLVAKWWLNIRMPSEYLGVILISSLIWRKKK